MHLDVGDVDDLRRAVSEGAQIRLSDVRSMSLGAAFEIAVAYSSWRDTRDQSGFAVVSSLRAGHPNLSQAIDLLDGVTPPSAADYDAPSLEILPAPRSLGTVEWALFGQRLKRSLERIAGFDVRRALAFSKVISELADNIIEHSSEPGTPPAPGLVGYEVGPGRMTISVGDLGRGVRASLAENLAWRDKVPDSRSALTAAVLQRASRRSDAGMEGMGLYEVQKVLVDLDGSLRFRSGDTALTLDGPGDSREIRRSDSVQMPGFQVTVSCSTLGKY
jgi:hypothetical protein